MGKIKLLSFLSLFWSLAYADGSESGKVTSIIVEGNNHISIWLDGADYTSECSGGGRWTIEAGSPLYKEQYSTILAAAVSGKSILLAHKSSNGCGPWLSNKVYYVRTIF